MSFKPISKHEFRSLLGQRLDKTRPCAIALSGGVDSIALASLLVEQSTETSPTLYAFTVNHNLRSESTKEAQDVHRQAQAMGIHHEILEIGPLPNTGVEAKARIARYTALTNKCLEYGIRDLYLAHHADDQAETILMRLIQGSRWRGLIGMHSIARNPLSRSLHNAHQVSIRRPLLSVPKSRLIATCTSKNIRWHEDATNMDVSLTTRNAIRNMLKNPTCLPRALRPASLLASSYEFLHVADVQSRFKKEIFSRSYVVLCESSCAITWHIRPLIDACCSDDLRTSFLHDICRIVSPTSDIDRNVLENVLSRLLQHDNDDRKFRASGSGLLWSIDRDICTVERQPFSRTESHSHVIHSATTPLTTSILFDRRFWISITGNRRPLIVRNVQKSDIAQLRKMAEIHDQKDVLEAYHKRVKGNVRFTLPIILEQCTGTIIALPSANISFDSTFKWQCSLSGKHFLEDMAT